MQEVAERHCLRPEDSDATPRLNTPAKSGNSSLKAPSGEREAEALRFQCAEESRGCILHIQVPGGPTWGAGWAWHLHRPAYLLIVVQLTPTPPASQSHPQDACGFASGRVS